ncbi:TPA: acyl-CoA synthetase [Pseudomonas aeruginosa]|nr:acyl-CoA synthetase [Pseudomonas aeruginosa]HBO2581255.1 acyl-CoA synthetase [Pseudomonas aeruginosa]HBO2600064.1 acyl-CoA synthetase [Pseudomonas aeruginosa]HCK0545476.1 acyl-CoA synthetase [Pseudomonas aeruginosa]HEP7917647.1 acyl-CoA synthetase [Pseudomonas aeruginosa]
MISLHSDILTIEQAALPNADVASTYALLQRSAERYANAPALSFFFNVEQHQQPHRWSYAELFADITRAANLFRRLGVNRGDVVAVILPNLPENHIAMWGAETAGIAFAVNNQLEGAQMGELLRAAKTRWVVTAGVELDAQIHQRALIACRDLPDLQGVLLVNGQRYLTAETVEQWADSADFNQLLAAEAYDRLQFAPPSADDVAAYFCTGGSTGLPKIAQHSQRNEVTLCGQLNAVIGEPVLHHGSTVLTALPLFHVNALLGTGLAVFAEGGHSLLATPVGFRAPGLIPRFWEIVETHKVNSFSGVPTIYAGLLQVPVGKWDTSSLTVAICGAAPMPAELIRRFEQQTGLRILEGYGLTESTCAASISPAKAAPLAGSIGMRLPWQDMRAMILDEAGQWLRDADTDESGVICLSGANVFIGYLDDAHNRGAWFTTADGRRWFNTGDLGRQDSEGNFWLIGRKKELIIRGGHNIDPRSIEDALASHPAVAMCAAVGRPDSYAGELPVAYVQLRQGSTTTTQELMAHAEQTINERAAIPKELILVDALPLTAVGKTFKPALVIREVEQTIRREAATLGLPLDTVEVEQCSRQGLVARYRCQGDHAQLANVLAGYTFSSHAL